MRNAIAKLTVVLLAQGIASAHAGDVNVGVSISGQIQPGVYGRIDIGNAAPPPVVYAQPVLIVPQPRPVYVEPLYLHVPPGHARNWAKHCHRYNACGQPVYFVRSNEYERDSYYGHGNHDHDYERYRYNDRDDRHDDHHDNGRHGDHDDHGHGKHKGDKHKDRDDR